MFYISPHDKDICLIDPPHFAGALNQPIFQTSIFAFTTIEDFIDYRDKKKQAFCYSRGNNPTTGLLESKLAKLDQGEACRVFSSGMGAISATFLSLLKSGDHVIIINNVYGPTRDFMLLMQNYGISHDIVDSLDELSSLIKPNTRIIYTESPGTLSFKSVDLRKLCLIAKKHNIISIIDNTCLTPLLQKPLTLGFEIVVYSLSKYTGGHSDILAGAVITSNELLQKIDKYGYKLSGSVLSPNDAFLILRGLRTLPARLECLYKTTLDVVDFLSKAPQVAEVLHPLCYNAHDKETYYSQSSGITSLLSIKLNCKESSRVKIFINALKTFYITVSWGGFENLVMVDDLSKLKQDNCEGLIIRLALGLQDSQTIISDLNQAFADSGV